MHATITIEMNNAAFENNELKELARILSKLANTLVERQHELAEYLNRKDPGYELLKDMPTYSFELFDIVLKDINGNSVGFLAVKRTD